MIYIKYLVFVFSIILIGCREGINNGEPVGSVDIEWEQTNGPFSMNVYSMTTTASGAVLIAGESGVYISRNDGDTWQLSSIGNHIITHLSRGSNSEVLAFYDHTFFISTDDGNNWMKKSIPAKYYSIENILYYKDGTILLYSYNNNFLLSKDNGDSWKELLFPTKNYIRTFTVGKRGTLFFGTYGSGIIYTDDLGTTWKQLDTNITGTQVSHLKTGENGILYMNSNLYKLAKSTDNGNSWQYINNNITEKYLNLLLKTKKGYLATGTSTKIYSSTDEGLTWKTIDIQSIFPHSLAQNDDNMFLASNTSGVLRSRDNGLSWEDMNNGLINSFIYFITIDDCDNVYANSGSGSLFISMDKEGSWRKIPGPLNGYYSGEIFINGQGNIFVGATEGNLYKSIDNGTSWRKIANNNLQSQHHTFSMKENSRGDLYSLGHMGDLFHSGNKGEAWEKIKLPCERARLFEIDREDNLFVVSGYPYDDVIDFRSKIEIYISTDHGKNWMMISNDIPEKFNFRSATDKDGFIYLIIGMDLYRFIGSGARWKSERIFTSDKYLIYISADKRGNLFLLGTDNEIYISKDNGFSWQKSIFPVSRTRAVSLGADSKGNIYLGSDGMGIYKGRINR